VIAQNQYCDDLENKAELYREEVLRLHKFLKDLVSDYSLPGMLTISSLLENLLL